ncbi:hypothetical protein Ahy_B05g074198 [Arachis hypogaea]|uniref:Uncharacterized protein n=1 Tax=Arachis hypogaea TaxID=3818 RepID=A0A444YY67_ARAHY|nr:hypothetical protein Ahy_B05g074198 [Arachis hypogaea]
MQHQSTGIDFIVFLNLISGCIQVGDLLLASSVQAFVLKYGRDKEEFIENLLITMYAKFSDLASARRIFDLIIKKSIFSWTSMIAGYAHSDHPLKALHLFRRLVRTDFRSDGLIAATVLYLGSISVAQEMEDYISLNGLEFDLQVQTSLIHMYSKCGSIKKAKEVFESGRQRFNCLVFHDKYSYIEANMKVESTASELLRADNLKSNLENNKNQFNDTVETLKRAAAKVGTFGGNERGNRKTEHDSKEKERCLRRRKGTESSNGCDEGEITTQFYKISKRNLDNNTTSLTIDFALWGLFDFYGFVYLMFLLNFIIGATGSSERSNLGQLGHAIFSSVQKVTSARSEVDVEEEQGSPMAPLEAKHSACKLPDLLHESFTTYLTWFRNVEDLDLSEQNFTVLDESLKELCSLRSLSLNGCRELREIKGIPPNIKYFSARNCISLTYARKYMLLNKELHEDGAKDFVLPSSSIPKWVEHSSNNDSISFWFHNKLPEISLCVLVGPAVDLSRTHICPEFIINSSRGQAEHLESVETSNQLVDHIFITDPKLMKSKVNEVILKNEWNHVVCTIKSCGQRGPAIKKLGIYFHKDRSSVANIQFIDPLLHKEELIMGNFQINMQQQKYMASHERRLSLDLPLGMSFSLNDHVSREPNSSVQGPCVDDLCTLRLGLDYIDLPCHASSERDYGSDSTLLSLATQAVLDHPANILAEYSQSPFLAETQNLQAPLFPSSLSGMAIREEFHHKTCCTVLPTTTDDDADDLEMEGFYASLDAETNVI